jgi:hypothetical protein
MIYEPQRVPVQIRDLRLDAERRLSGSLKIFTPFALISSQVFLQSLTLNIRDAVLPMSLACRFASASPCIAAFGT